jgi:hypothetical protein
LYDGATWYEVSHPQGTYTSANGICGNAIVGSYRDSGGIYHGYLLTIPEPASLALLVAGGLLAIQRRRI